MAYTWSRAIVANTTLTSEVDFDEIVTGADYVTTTHCPANYLSVYVGHDSSYRTDHAYDSSDYTYRSDKVYDGHNSD